MAWLSVAWLSVAWLSVTWDMSRGQQGYGLRIGQQGRAGKWPKFVVLYIVLQKSLLFRLCPAGFAGWLCCWKADRSLLAFGGFGGTIAQSRVPVNV